MVIYLEMGIPFSVQMTLKPLKLTINALNARLITKTRPNLRVLYDFFEHSLLIIPPDFSAVLSLLNTLRNQRTFIATFWDVFKKTLFPFIFRTKCHFLNSFCECKSNPHIRSIWFKSSLIASLLVTLWQKNNSYSSLSDSIFGRKACSIILPMDNASCSALQEPMRVRNI